MNVKSERILSCPLCEIDSRLSNIIDGMCTIDEYDIFIKDNDRSKIRLNSLYVDISDLHIILKQGAVMHYDHTDFDFVLDFHGTIVYPSGCNSFKDYMSVQQMDIPNTIREYADKMSNISPEDLQDMHCVIYKEVIL